jgi:divalent metal cation (Fe/Co/Zn/Cd) transporter
MRSASEKTAAILGGERTGVPAPTVSLSNMSVPSNAIHEPRCCDGCESGPVFSRQVAWLQYVTMGWMLVECSLSLFAAAGAHSVALLAFGSDSLVELFSATVVLLQFSPRFPLKKIYADRAAGALLFLLAAAVAAIAFFSWRGAVEVSRLGIGITAAALVVMPLLAWLKRRHARAIKNSALAADAVQSATCAYLAGITLIGLVTFALWRISWIDAVAALAAIPVLLIEGRRAWRGEACGCAA